MSTRYFETTHTFRAEASIPYEYTCAACKKPVAGVLTLPFSYGYRKTAPRREDLALTENERRGCESKLRSSMQSDLAIYKAQVEKGNFDLLRSVSACPHCGASQRWGHRPGKSLALLAVGALLLAGTIAGAVWFFGNGGTFYSLPPAALIGGAGAGTLGAMLIPMSIVELRKSKAACGPADARPVVRFPQ